MFIELISAYGLLALTHLFVQMNLAHAEYLRTLNEWFNPAFTPSATIIIPTYNEDEESLSDCVQSCLNQDYKGKWDIVVVNDGSKNSSGRKAFAKFTAH